MRTLTQRELNRALLARQGLLERLDLPLPRFVERIGGLQTQYAPSAYIGTWSRLAGFAREDLTRGLERRTLVQASLMRSTIHVVSRRDYWPIAVAIREPQRQWWLRATRYAVDEATIGAQAERIRTALADGPRRRPELTKALGMDSTTWNGASGWLDLVRIPPNGTWEQRRADRYGLAESWIGPPAAGLTARDGAVLLVRRYLTGFGPASRNDVASFAGLPLASVDAALGDLRLRRFASEDGEELLDLPARPLPDPSTPAPVRFLPTWDATLLVHARRTQILPERHRPKVFHVTMPHSLGTVLVDGQVAGTWRHEDGRIRVESFEPLARKDRRAVDEEAERLATFMA
jgi:hypothetical protein